jgi:hypothetical protein
LIENFFGKLKESSSASPCAPIRLAPASAQPSISLQPY